MAGELNRPRERLPGPAGRGSQTGVGLFVFLALALAVSCSLGSASAGAQEGPTGCWKGRLERDGLVWDLGLDVSELDGELVATYDSRSLWRAREPLPSFASDGDRVRFELPWSMGWFRGALAVDRLAGEVTFADGRQVSLDLRRAPCRTPRREEISWSTGAVSIAGSLTLPPGRGPFPAVVVVHGAGDSSRETPPYRFWGDYLPRIGVACLLYDKRGNGRSTGDWREVGFEPRARDVAGGLARLRTHPDIDAERLGLLAVSQGSWVAGIAARLHPGVQFVVNISGPAVSVADADTYALQSALRREGWAEEDLAERVGLWKLNLETIREPASEAAWQRLQAAIDAARGKAWFAADPYEPDRGDPWRSWYRRVADHDPRPLLETLDTPMLWIYGAMDSQSDPARNVAVLEDLRRQGMEVAISLYPEAGHGLLVPVDPCGRDGERLTTAPGFFLDLERWLRRRTLLTGPERTFANGVFTSPSLPRISLRMDSGLEYLGSTKFDLPERARVERHHWADTASDGRLERLLILHFEGFPADSDETYRYGIPPAQAASGPDFRFTTEPLLLGRHDYIHNTWFFDGRESIRARPEGELARTARLLESRGLALPDELAMSRFARVVDEQARHELILFYLEPLAATGFRAEEFVEGGAGAAALARLSAEITARSLAALAVEAD